MYDNESRHKPTDSPSNGNRSFARVKPNSAMAPSDTTMRELWMWMAVFYSAKWSSSLGDTFGESGPAGAMWRAGLVGITSTQIGDGMKRCAEREDKWPPGLQEFRDLCLPPAVDHSEDWKSAKADKSKMPSAERIKWHEGNIAWIKSGRELPRPDWPEPPAPAGCRPMMEVYKGVLRQAELPTRS